jgi:hypothetical protein
VVFRTFQIRKEVRTMSEYRKLEVRVLGDPAELIQGVKGAGHDGGDINMPLLQTDDPDEPEL